ncbi:interferon-induced very large GTPase 1 isoform X1 [Danio rerio]|uniref:Interferon-induced very large GTPase 1 isoform X1 n=3 Tax=Danio rerio TaxID=7955 RepID=A0AC58J1Y0_DANRE|nr:interferon-induced very large GTPase 1-like [Danio rerio]|eukprot:XP_021329336.1 interferon-induced very large GTPase 1-like [Danio rerio]
MGNSVPWLSNKSNEGEDGNTCTQELGQRKRKSSESCQETKSKKPREDTPSSSTDYQLDQETNEQDKDIQSGSRNQPDQHEDMGNIKQKNITLLLSRLNLRSELKVQDFLQLTSLSLQWHEPCEEKNLVQTFIQRLVMMDYRARYIAIKEEPCEVLNTQRTTSFDIKESNAFEKIFNRSALVDEPMRTQPIHPMDIQMAVFLNADNFLRQLIVTKLSQCQYALPLLVPNPFTQEIEFPLWTFRQIKKSWKSHNTNISKSKTICQIETPLVVFFRLSSVFTSKSELVSNLINERHESFFHRHCRGSSKSRLLMDGVVEIAWYCPSGEKTDKFTDCVAFCNLHGDAQANKTQLQILTEESSVNVMLLPNLDRADKSMAIVEELYKSPKPLICLLTEDDSSITEMQKGKYKIGLKDRNKSDVSEEIRRTINESLLNTTSTFKLDNLVRHSAIKVDENHDECRYGHTEAKKMMRVLERKELPKIKETFLPCQGKLWHEWCLKNKELHRPKGSNIETHTSQKQTEMQQIRQKQKAYGISAFMKMFTEKLKSRNTKEKMYFLKWLGILLDEFTSEDLCKLHHEYDETWSKVLDLKKKHYKTEQMTVQQTQLENLSENLNAATFGLEHILREIGQIYESGISVKKNKGSGCELDIRSLPHFAAELMVSGYPMELMDGDAAHVPLIWVQAVLDKLIKLLGDQRVFVLSVLGIQSTGKSTMLNAMFGLQFAVSAGRCTRGAFMQLVKVSEELKSQLNFDYILVVDTEGLRALELAGRSTRHHDNEMATFVVGLGNMTLINIFGENPAEMQDILQIVVQAFLRMKKVRLNPSCMFVHQNVGDITAGDKNMVGKRRLQEKLDEMTQLAAKEEVCDAECFGDVIKFDIKTDVRYFAQLWEGSPPMAPPNPCYSENVQELKSKILLHASKCSGVTLTQFKNRIGDLWNALLNENFVFSFKNTLEIAVYRKLEEEYAKWTWTLRSAMLEVEDNLHNRINNRQLHKVEIKNLEKKISETYEEVKVSINQYFEKHKEKEMLIQWKSKFQEKIKHLHRDLVRDTKRRLENIVYQRETLTKLDRKKTLHEKKLLEKSKELAFILKKKGLDENELKAEFDSVWENWVSQLAVDVRPLEDINIEQDIITIISEIHEEALVHSRLNKSESISQLTNFNKYINPIKKICNVFRQSSFALLPEEQESITQLVHRITCETRNLVKSKSVAKMGYNTSYIQEIAQLVKMSVENHECKVTKYKFKKEFTVDLTIFACKQAGEQFAELHRVFREANDPIIYLEKKKPEYYSVFQAFCRGATSAAVFGALICSELKEPIIQSVYNKTASDLAGEMRTNIPAFKGNRSNLEKHILKALAEEEDFQKFIQYIHFPREQFEGFIKSQVKAFITEGNSSAVAMIQGNIRHKEQCVITAAETATAQVLGKAGDANIWLEIFSDCLKDELEYSKEHLTGDCCQDITDFELLEEVVKKELRPIIEDLNRCFKPSSVKMRKFRKPPDEILIEHFCNCCWAQCPFCKAICINTMEDHPGDHIVPFHRNCGIRGMIYKGTTNLSLTFCTSSVASDTQRFCPDIRTNETVLWKEYRTAGPHFANWCITPDLSELPYWKWFVCRFQAQLEKCYNYTFDGCSEIPKEWRTYTKEQALESLEKYM